MAPYADALHCPECGGELALGATECPSCGLSLTGPVAAQLYSTLVEADRLLAEMQHPKKPRSELPPLPGAPKPSPTAAEPTAESTASGESGPRDDSVPAQAGRSRLSGRQVPKILLTLGAACLLGAAVIFLAVSWSRLGVGGRTAVLLVMTVVAGVTTAWAGRRRLTTAFEAFGVITLGLWSLDLFGAAAAGWVGHFSQSVVLIGVGGALVVTGLGASVSVTGVAGLDFRAGEAFGALGAVLYATGVVTFEALPLEQRLVVALLGTIVTAQAATAFHLPVAVAGGTAASLAVWIALVWHGTNLAVETPGWHKLWLQGHGWPLMVAALLPWLPAFAQALPPRARQLLVGIGGLPLVILLGLPSLNYSPERGLLLGLAVLAASSLVVRVAPAPVGSGWAIPTSVLVMAGTLLAVDYAGLGVRRIAGAASRGYTGDISGSLAPMLLPDRVPDPAFNGLLCLALVVAVWAIAGRVWTSLPRDVPLRALISVVAAMAWLGITTVDLPVWVWVATATAASAGFAGEAARSRNVLAVLTSAGFAAAAVVTSLYSAPLNAIAAGVGILTAVLIAITNARPLVRAAAAGSGAVLLVNAIWATRWWLVGAGHPGTALFATCTLAVLVVGLAGPAGHHQTPSGWLPAWYGVGGGALLSWPVLCVAAAAVATDSPALWLAASLATIGASLAAAGLLAGRHLFLVPLGTAVIALASWISLADLGVGTPEAYTLPWAFLLLIVGTVQVLQGRGSSLRSLTPGLALALMPSLLWVFARPESLRALFLGVACLGLVLFGARARWAGPLLSGSVSGLAEVIRLAAPYAAHAIPRWALIGAAGTILVIVGVTWERRLAQARVAWRYVTRLR